MENKYYDVVDNSRSKDMFVGLCRKYYGEDDVHSDDDEIFWGTLCYSNHPTLLSYEAACTEFDAIRQHMSSRLYGPKAIGNIGLVEIVSSGTKDGMSFQWKKIAARTKFVRELSVEVARDVYDKPPISDWEMRKYYRDFLPDQSFYEERYENTYEYEKDLAWYFDYTEHM